VVTVLVAGGERRAAPVRRAVSEARELPVELRLRELPNTPAEPAPLPDVSGPLASARQRYVEADFAGCLRATGDAELPATLLGAGRRDLAARVLLWRVACRVGAGEPEEAARAARALAVYELDVPADVAATTPEVEAVLAAESRAIAGAPRVPLRVRADLEGAAVALDGRAAACVAPCTLDVRPGDHVVQLTADGVLPVVRSVRAEGAASEVVLATTAAPPATAAAQWTARYGTSPALDSAPSVRLLSRAVAAPSLLLVLATGDERATHLSGVLAADGTPRARAARTVAPALLAEPTRALLRELLVRGGVVIQRPLWEDPLFWLAVGVAAVGAAGVTGYLLYHPPVRTELHF
jgi:hypothetical protein